MGTGAAESKESNITLGNNVHVDPEPDTRAVAEHLFNAPAAGGKISLPLQEMFCGARSAASPAVSACIGWSTAAPRRDRAAAGCQRAELSCTAIGTVGLGAGADAGARNASISSRQRALAVAMFASLTCP